jgi:hypothetical protein
MPVASSVMTAKGVTSEPVPEVVGMATHDRLPAQVRKGADALAVSMKRMAISSNLRSAARTSAT